MKIFFIDAQAHDVEHYATWALLARDSWPYAYPAYVEERNKRNLYGVYPFLMALEKDYKAHGLLILNTNPQDITIGPAPHIVYRTIGGILDLYFFPGPSPEDVVRQYLAFVGTPMLPAYWALGFQLGSLGYKNWQDLENVGWEGFPSYVEQLHNESLHVIVVLQPGVQADGDPFKRALQENASFVEWETKQAVQKSIQNLYPLANETKIMLGVLRANKHVAYPDFTAAETKSWWMEELADFHKTISYDGLWMVRNEPSSLETNEDQPGYWYNPEHTNITSLHCPVDGSSAKYDVPPYQTQNVYHYNVPTYLASTTLCMSAMTKQGRMYDVKNLYGLQQTIATNSAMQNITKKRGTYLASTTLCMSAMTKQGRMYDVKNLYGLQQTIATNSAMQNITKKRGVLITRSSYPSGGRYAGHSLGNNFAAWEDMAASVVAIQEFNMFGIPYVGADICGYADDTTEELCLRWQQLGAFYTLSRCKRFQTSQLFLGVKIFSATHQISRYRYKRR
uniref:Alpha-glucosidase n=1 Tax=Ascaris lumbricoides TaxID=6252 RepID=A0A0M3IQW2_ASCLU